MDLQVKKKKVFILCAILTITVLFCIMIAYSLRDNKLQQGKCIEGTIVEKNDGYLSICDEREAEYIISLEADYKGVSLDTLSEGDLVKIWFKGEIAETYPMQIITYKIEKY